MKDYLGDLVVGVLEEKLPPGKLLLFLIESKLKKNYGIILSRKQKAKLQEQLEQNFSEEVEIALNRYQQREFKELETSELVLDFDDKDLEAIKKDIEDAFVEVSLATSSWLSKKLTRDWKSQSSEILRRIQKERAIFNRAVSRKWGKALDKLESLISICLEMGMDFNREYRPTAVKENDFVFDALTRLQARGCQVSLEILLLLRNGFADGAHARWRTLHEIATEASLIKRYGNEVAERYLCHSVVADYKIAKKYKEHSSSIGYQPMEEHEFENVKQNCEEALKRFGKGFGKSDYGWASKALEKGDKCRITFEEIEQKAGISHMRPFVQLSHANVHSGSKGTTFRLGLPPKNRDRLLVGPSIFGLSVPAQNTAFSINLLTGLLLVHVPSLDQVALVMAIQRFSEEVIGAFNTSEPFVI
ncbi:MAG: hypothetical protein HY781_09910 [Chloroflexi bacterium]|nr:hypothetical protein [Chloroflexota bacterium]